MINRASKIVTAAATAFFAVASVYSAAPPASAATNDDLIFGVVPQQSASKLAQIWVPLVDHLSQVTGRTIRFGTAKDIPTFEACLAQGAYDLAYMNPYHYTTFHDVSGYQAFARQANKRLRGLIVVHKDSPYERLEDLDNQAIAFPSPAAFGASVIPRAEMKRRNLAIEPSYVKSHDSVYRAVVAGLFPAGGGVLRTFGNIPEDLRDQLRVLYETDAYTPHAFAAHRSVDEALVADIAGHMLALENQRPELLQAIGMPGVQPALDADWDDVRSLNLTETQTEIVVDERLTCHSG
ncbi:MAG: phosphate/phosphite/phosphonate ABC transporter substrate-binding protein [Pseudomonadota bacterium]